MKKDKKYYRILVMEDNPGDFTLVKEFLTDQIADPKIVHALNFKEGSAILRRDQDRSPNGFAICFPWADLSQDVAPRVRRWRALIFLFPICGQRIGHAKVLVSEGMVDHASALRQGRNRVA